MPTAKTPKKLVLTFLDGPKSGTNMSFDFQSGKALLLGRSPEADIQIENSGNDVVSRKHAEILIQTGQTFQMSITDLDSTNGLFVNGQRISNEADLMPGDEVQFGKNGPRYGVDVNPRPAQVLSKTRVISVPEVQATRELVVEEADSFMDSEVNVPAPQADGRVGKDTVERMIQTSQKKGKNTNVILGIGTLLALGLAAFLFFRPAPEVVVGPGSLPPTTTDNSLTPAMIVKKYGDATARIETRWKLVHSSTGEDIYHYYDEIEIDEQGNRAVVAYYIQLPNGGIEPYCTAGKETVHSKIILGGGQGSGFVVDQKGFIMTNRHVAEGWKAPFTFPPGAFPGILVQGDQYGNPIPKTASQVTEESLRGFVPANLQRLGNNPVEKRIVTGKAIFMDVMFPGDDNRWPVTSTNASNDHDVALIKIDYAGTLEPVNFEARKPEPGDNIVIVGYPGLSPKEYMEQASKDMFNTRGIITEIVKPSTVTGTISKIMSGDFSGTNRYSAAGETYELTGTNFTPGASGSPVFDKEGTVIAVFNSSISTVGATLNYAVPIAEGMELLGRKSTAR